METAAQSKQMIKAFRRDIVRRECLANYDKVHKLVFANLISLVSLNAPVVRACTELRTHALKQEDEDLGVVFMPTFVWKVGRPYAQEISILKALGESRLCLDREFSLTFESKPDTRDLRPCSYEGRFMTSARYLVESFRWRGAEVVKTGRLDGGSLLRVQGVRKVVECDEQAMPKPDADKLNRAQKWCQLEVTVWEALLRSLVTGFATLAEPDAVLMLVDLQPDVGDLGLAALHYAGGLQHPHCHGDGSGGPC